MTNVLRRISNILFAFLLTVFSVNLSGVLSVAPAHAAANNGTLKIHELNTPSGTESNDPKVCAFNFEGFGFDPGQSGYIIVETQPGGVSSLSPSLLDFGPADASGNYATAYINNGGTYSLPDGHYKATLYGKQTGNPALPDLTDEKAKSKNFKVECAAPTTVTPTAPTQVDQCGTANDTYTIPTTVGVDYKISGNTVTSATYPGSGSVTITAAAQPGYALQGTTSWTFTFTDVACVITVTATAPTKVDLCGTPNDTYTIPVTTGVTYKVNNTVKTAGTYSGSGTVTITAVANPGYVLTGQTSWTLTFSSVKCNVTPAPATYADVCGYANDSYTIPTTANVSYKVNNTVKAAGTYAGSGIVYIQAVPAAGYQIQGQNDWLFVFTNLPCPATPTAPSHSDQCGTANDTYTIPATTGIKYQVNGVVKPAGTYQGSGIVFVDADAQPGYFIPLFTQQHWLFIFNSHDCSVQATAPTQADLCGTANDTYTIPTKVGVIYKINGNPVTAGTYNANGSTSLTITSEALPGYALTGPTSWIIDFTNTACPASKINVTAICSPTGVIVTLTNSGNADGTATVNGTPVSVASGVSVDVTVPLTLYKASVIVMDDAKQTLLEKDFDCTPGRGNAGGDTPATPSPLVVTPASASKVLELPETGANPFIQALTLLIIGLGTYTVMYLVINRRERASK